MDTKEAVFQFLKNGLVSSDENFFYCQTRDQSLARLSKWISDFKRLGISETNSAILVAVVGEITNNSFDHNLGQWHEQPGCIVAFEKTKESLIIFIADRGQGVVSSLGKSLNTGFSKDDILKKAFEERISGRAPEKRGNGLKFVVKHLLDTKKSLQCWSQQAVYSFGSPTVSITSDELPKDFGTLTCIEWSLT